jgi:hypothetical protein
MGHSDTYILLSDCYIKLLIKLNFPLVKAIFCVCIQFMIICVQCNVHLSQHDIFMEQKVVLLLGRGQLTYFIHASQ